MCRVAFTLSDYSDERSFFELCVESFLFEHSYLWAGNNVLQDNQSGPFLFRLDLNPSLRPPSETCFNLLTKAVLG